MKSAIFQALRANKRLFLLLFVLSMSIITMAQTSLKGRVIDQATKTAVVCANVTLANQNISTTTNSLGEYTLLYLEAMDEEIIVEADGYIAAIELVNLVANRINQMSDIQLQQDIMAQTQSEMLCGL